MRKLIFLFVTALLLLPSAVWACGGFFSADDPMNQSAERMIFTVNGDGTITVIVGIDYQGEANDFSWLLPVPSIPELEVVERDTLDELQASTNVVVSAPQNYCSALNYLDGAGGGGGGILLGSVGPYEYAILGGEDTPDVIGWLRDNGYKVDEKAEPIIQEYLDMGMYFVAMRLQQNATYGDIQPVQLTFEAENPMIPIKLASVAAEEVVPVYVWIFADMQYAPENYANEGVDFSTFEGPNQLGSVYAAGPDSYVQSQYERKRNELQAKYDGHVFITEYAQETIHLPAPTDPLLAELTRRFPYVTRLRAQLSPEQMTIDPVFVPAPEKAPVSNQVNLNEYVDPLEYWHCTSRVTLTQEQWQTLPEGRTRIEEWSLELAHPADWQQSNFEIGGHSIVAFAPEPVDASNFLNGDIPVLFAYRWERPTFELFQEDFSRKILNELASLAGITDEVYPHGFDAMGVRPDLYLPAAYSPDGSKDTGIIVGIAAKPELWHKNRALYEAMIAYGKSFQHYRHPELQHTLFLTADYWQEEYSFHTHIEVPYPADWREHINENGVITIAPDVNGARIRLQPIPIEQRHAAEDIENQIETLYGLPADTAWEWFDETPCHGSKSVYFEYEGRAGYVRRTNLYILEASAPVEDIAEMDSLLQNIVNSTLSDVVCG